MVNTKVITCAGYYGTGSSAITDLLGEFSSVHFLGDFEFRFVQDPGGIADLEYNIVDNYHRHNSGHALKRFRKNIDFLCGNKFNRTYENSFQGQFKKLSMEYIDSLTAFKFKGYWHQDVIDRGFLFWFVERALDKILNRVVVPIIRGRNNIEPISLSIAKTIRLLKYLRYFSVFEGGTSWSNIRNSFLLTFAASINFSVYSLVFL